MRAIFQTVSATALGLFSLGLGTTARADTLSITYSDAPYGDPAYLVHYRYGTQNYVPRHAHHYHYVKPYKHHKHRGHHKHHKHHKHASHHETRRHHGSSGHHSHWGDDRRRHGAYYGKRDDHRWHNGDGRRDHDGDHFRGRGKSRSHDTHARR